MTTPVIDIGPAVIDPPSPDPTPAPITQTDWKLTAVCAVALAASVAAFFAVLHNTPQHRRRAA
jgi:predicted hotdog family 3-hydroxylacyl-ACP dehydratase